MKAQDAKIILQYIEIIQLHFSVVTVMNAA
jgi:hypothetical protein